MTSMNASVPVRWSVALPLLLCGCTGDEEGKPPVEQYEDIIAHARAGRLTSAWKSLLPPGYERDLDAVLAKLVQLVDEAEYDVLRDALSSGGRKLAGLLALGGSDDPAMKLVIAKLREIPRLFGVDTYERFRKLDVASLLAALEDGLFREVMQLESIRQKVSSVSFELKERRRDWARLRVRFEPPDGEPVTQEMGLIRFEGRWVPADWVTDWPATMRSLREQIEVARKLKLETPEAFRKSLAAVREAMQNPSSLLARLPELGKHFGFGKDASG